MPRGSRTSRRRRRSPRVATMEEDDDATPMATHPRAREPRYRLSGPQTRGTAYTDASYRVLQQCHPGLDITVRAQDVVDAFLNDMFERVAREASRLRRRSDAALTRSEIETATRLVLPGSVKKHALIDLERYFNEPPPENRPGLVFPGATMTTWLRKGRYAPRVDSDAGFALAVVLEFLVAEVLELAGEEAKGLDSPSIMLCHVALAIRRDGELDRLVLSRTLCPSERYLFDHASNAAVYPPRLLRASERLNAIDASPRTLFQEVHGGPGSVPVLSPYSLMPPPDEFRTLLALEIFDV